MTDDRDFTAYVAARWVPLVRCLVALGAPLGPAEATAADALSRCHDDWDARDEWADLDVHVFRELLDAWERRRDAWWERPVPQEEDEVLGEGAWLEIEPVLDRMTVAKRRALVLHGVAGLGADQAREVAGTDPWHPDPALVARLHTVMEALPVDPPRIEAMIAASGERKRRRRLVSVAAVLAVLVIAGAVTALVVRHDDGSSPEAADGFGPVRTEAEHNASPIPFYSDGKLYLPDTILYLHDVRAFAAWNDGAVYLDVRGNLVTVDAAGDRTLVHELGPDGSFAVSDLDDRLVWIDPDVPELVEYDLTEGERVLETRPPDRSELAYLEGRRAYVTSGSQFSYVELDDGSIHPAVDRRLPFELDRHGRFVLSRDNADLSASEVRLTDTATDRAVALGIDDPGDVSAAGFAADGAVVLLVEPPGSGPSEIRRCAPPYDRCPPVGYFTSGGAPAVLAH